MIRTFFAVCFALLTPVLFAEEVSQVGSLSTGPVTVLGVTSINMIEKVISDESPSLSYVVVEITGVCESQGELEELVATFESKPNSSEAWKRLEMKLYSANPNQKTVNVEGGFALAVSKPKPFSVKVRLSPMVWHGGANLYFDGPQRAQLWTVSLGVQKIRPAYYTHYVGFTAELTYINQTRKWSNDVFGLEQTQ